MEPNVNTHNIHPYNLYPNDLAVLDPAAPAKLVQLHAHSIDHENALALTRVLTRYKMPLHKSDRGCVGQVMPDDDWEIWRNQLFAPTIQPGICIIDVGANDGYYTRPFADIVTQSGKVIAAEPSPTAASQLRQSVRLNGFDTCTQAPEVSPCAMPETTGHLIVTHPEPTNADVSAHPEADATVHRVLVTTGDAVADDLDRVDFIRIDAEGREETIINGMPQSLQWHKQGLAREFNTQRCTYPADLIERLTAVDGSGASIGYDGVSDPVERDRVLHTWQGEDWMLYFSVATD